MICLNATYHHHHPNVYYSVGDEAMHIVQIRIQEACRVTASLFFVSVRSVNEKPN